MNYIFDFDGTIADSLEKGIEIINKFLKEENKQLITKVDVRKRGISYIIKSRKISKITTFVLLLQARNEISKHMDGLKSFKGLPYVIKELSKKNNLGIISSNSQKNVKSFLKRYKLLEFFSFINDEKDWFGKDKKIIKTMNKYNLSSKDTVYIGDEGRDIQAAKNAGLKSIAVTWGFESKLILRKYFPDVIVDTPEKLLTLKLS